MAGRNLASSETTVRVGVLGYGNVGAALVRLIDERAEQIAEQTGIFLEVRAIAVTDLHKHRATDERLTDDAFGVVNDPAIDVVVELIGGIDPARPLIASALKAGKPVVSANKELLATDGSELDALSLESGAPLRFEAAVGGAIPLVRVMRVSLAGEKIERVIGIVNGTTNFMLSEMTEAGLSYEEALATAQRLGYAERDPLADVGGYDAQAKAAILASIAFNTFVTPKEVYREGIEAISAQDIAVAARLGYVVKLLAVAERFEQPAGAPASIGVRVHPAMVPHGHPLASVNGPFNAVFIEGDASGEMMLYGRGAGGRPTASAVLGDLLDAAHNLTTGGAGRTVTLHRTTIRPIDDLLSAYYIALEVADRPGVLHAVSGVLGQHRVSIRLMEQESLAEQSGRARLVFVTHPAYERDVQACLGELRHLDVVHSLGGLLRVIGS